MNPTLVESPRPLRRKPVLRIEDGSLLLCGSDKQNIVALLSAARGTLMSLAATLVSAESLLPVDTLEAPCAQAEQLDCLLQTAIQEVRRAS